MIHLHTHSMYSLRDSIIRPEELVQKIKDLGMSAVAVTDHGNTLGAVKFYKLCKEQNIKFIYGCEMYIADNCNREEKGKNYHLILLAKNEQGRINLNKLISYSNMPEHFYRKPRIDFEVLKEHKDGLIVLSACLAGELATYIVNSETSKATETAAKYKSVFGEDYYIELQAHGDETQISVNKELLVIANHLNISAVITTDAHHLNEEDRDYQLRYAFNGGYSDYEESYLDCYVQSEEEVRQKINYLDKQTVDNLIKNTEVIAAKCNVDIPLSDPIMPIVQVPKQYNNHKEYLNEICKRGFKEKLNIDISAKEHTKTEQQYIDRYKYELNALEKMGFIDYILLVYSYANYAEERGVARGSGGGSLINYVTNITDIDPLKYNLLFERFIDVGALDKLEKGEITAKELKIPDIDLDFSSNKLESVLLYLRDTYGEDKVASIGKYGYNLTKATIRDMCRSLEYGVTNADIIAKAFENYELDDIDKMINGELPVIDDAKKAISEVKNDKKLFRYVRRLNNLPKSFGLHACGKIIATRELDYYLPSNYDDNGVRFLMGDMHDIEDLGLIKIDLLGLRTITALFDALSLIGEDKSYIASNQPLTDKNIYEAFAKGDTAGIFQFSSKGMRQVLKKMNVSSIEDLIAANALYRPSALEHIDNYCDRKSGKEKTTYLHPDLKPILKETYGIMVYQEQLINIGKMAGLHNPDLLRKATGKKDIKLIKQVEPELHQNLLNKGWTEEQFNQLWEDTIKFASYSFNKSHAAAYSILAYMTMKIKVYHPLEFYASLFNSYIGRSEFVKEDAAEYAIDMCRHSVRFNQFDYRKDHRKCNVQDGKINYGIPLIKNLDCQTAETLYQISQSKDYDDFTALLSDMIDSKIAPSKIKILIKLNFFNQFGNTKHLTDFFEIYSMLKYGKAKRITKNKIEEFPHFNIIVQNSTETPSAYTIVDMNSILQEYFKTLSEEEEYPITELAKTQAEYFGFVFLGTNREEDDRKLLVSKVVPLKGQYNPVPWAYAIYYCAVKKGLFAQMTVRANAFMLDPIKEGDIVKVLSHRKDRNGYWNLENYSILTK